MEPFQVPVTYRLFFLYIEPFATLAGAYVAHFQPELYLQLTHAASAPPSAIPVGTRIIQTQLANLYLLFAVNEALVLRSTNDLRVWRALLVGLLIADFGHLYSVFELGPDIYWKAHNWNAIDWGNIAFVYAGATMRLLFLTGLGIGKPHNHTIR